LKAFYVFTHDSVAVGEDGPTHEPVEQLAGLRAIPGLSVIRPADATETAQAWAVAVQHNGPTLFALSRQNLPNLDRSRAKDADVAKGAYILAEALPLVHTHGSVRLPGEAEGGAPEVILIGSGSETALCVKAQERLNALGVRARVVSMPSWNLFDAQDAVYREGVLPSGFATDEGTVIGIDHFGASAPGEEIMKNFGFTAEHVTAAALRLLGRNEEAAREYGGETVFAPTAPHEGHS